MTKIIIIKKLKTSRDEFCNKIFSSDIIFLNDARKQHFERFELFESNLRTMLFFLVHDLSKQTKD